MRPLVRPLLLAAAAMAVTGAIAQTQGPPRVTTPKQQFGHELGADYVLPNYTQLSEYWQALDRQSDRMRLVDIGKTAEGRPQWMAIITAPQNFAKLARYKE